MSEKYDYVRFAKTLKEMLENNDNDFLEMKIAREAANDLYESLKTPTAEEVCEALGKTFEINVKYEKETKTFKFVCGGNIIYPSAYENQKNKIVINSMAMPPRLITLIGRFYESVVSL